MLAGSTTSKPSGARIALARSRFFGAMDGASKFVRGDAVAGLVITAINLVGGMIIGLLNGMPLAQAARRTRS